MAQRVKSHISGKKARAFDNFKVESMHDVRDLAKLGIVFDGHSLDGMYKNFASQSDVVMDAAPLAPLSTPSISTPIQFLQAWMPGFVQYITQARKIDELVGITTIGDWEDEEVVQGFSERTGWAQPYGDNTNFALGNYNVNYEARTVVRFDAGIRVGRLAEKRAAKMNYNDVENRRAGAVQSLEISRNAIGFYGYNNGMGRTYGYLNDPNLPAYNNVAAGAGGSTEWASKTALEIIKDLLTAIAGLRVQTGGNIDVKKTPLNLDMAMSCVDLLSTTTELGMSVLDWLAKNYPNITVNSAPELDAANGGADVAYLYAPEFKDGSSDDGLTISQVVPTKFITLGVEQTAKGYEEAYSNATAGCFVKRPLFIYRFSGI